MEMIHEKVYEILDKQADWTRVILNTVHNSDSMVSNEKDFIKLYLDKLIGGCQDIGSLMKALHLLTEAQ